MSKPNNRVYIVLEYAQYGDDVDILAVFWDLFSAEQLAMKKSRLRRVEAVDVSESTPYA